VFRVGDRIVRIVSTSGESTLKAFLSSRAAGDLTSSGALVASSYLDKAECRRVLATVSPGFDAVREQLPLIVEHERIPFPSFPYEWPPEMLAAAGNLTLDIAEALLEEGFGLKDATPYNILFRGPSPVFVDVLSAEMREPTDPMWLPYAQFVRTFVLPLLVHRFCRIPSSLYLAGRRDGIEPEEAYEMLSLIGKLRLPALTQVTIPRLLAKMYPSSNPTIYRRKSLRNASQAQFVLRSTVRSLRKNVRKVGMAHGQRSTWNNYMRSHSYSVSDFESKRAVVEQALSDFSVSSLLDVGCNTGFFSVLAARKRIQVVAIDTDPLVVGNLWKTASEEGLPILPLVVNIARPSPSMGWRNQECSSFLERSRNRFDAVLMLAVVHHLMTTEGVSLLEIFRLAGELTRKFLIVEYVDPVDPMFKQLVRGREALFEGLTQERFEATSRRFFRILRSHRLSPTRHIYVMAK